MTPTAAITSVITIHDDVDPSDPSTAALRTKYLSFLQQLHDYVWSAREWEWTWKEATLSVLANASSAALPSDFLSIGSQGALHDPQGVRMRPVSRYVLERLLRGGGAGSRPAISVFSIWGGSVRLPFTATSTTAYTFFYRYRSPTLADGGIGAEMPIPDRYVNTVLIPGLIWKSMTKKNDARETWGQQFQAGLAQMVSEENPLNFAGMKMPMAIRGGW